MPQGHLGAHTTGTKLQASIYAPYSTSVLEITDTRNNSLSKSSCEQCSVLLKRDSTVVHFGQRCSLLSRQPLTSKYRASFMEQPFKVIFAAHPICRSKQKALEYGKQMQRSQKVNPGRKINKSKQHVPRCFTVLRDVRTH